MTLAFIAKNEMYDFKADSDIYVMVSQDIWRSRPQKYALVGIEARMPVREREGKISLCTIRH